MLLLQLLCQREAPEIGPALVDDASGFVSFAAEFVSRKSLS
jgi:hypothetical protein